MRALGVRRPAAMMAVVAPGLATDLATDAAD
jgi:hypothetical protein